MPLTDEECLAAGFDRAAFMARARPYSYDHRQPTSLYVMQCGEHVRVGIAGDVARRAAAVQARNPLPVKVRHTREFSSRLYALMVEAEAHRSLKGYHVHGEWFSAPLPHVRRILALIYPCMRRLEQRYQAEEDARVEQLRIRYQTDTAYRAEHDEIDEAWLRQQLINAADRFSDVADTLEREGHPSASIGFLRASASRYRRAATARSHSEISRMEMSELLDSISPPPSSVV